MASKSKKGLGRGLGALFDDSKSEKSSEGFDFLPIYPIQKSQTAIV